MKTKCRGYGDTNSIELNPTSDFVRNEETADIGKRQQLAVLFHQNGKEATTVGFGTAFSGISHFVIASRSAIP